MMKIFKRKKKAGYKDYMKVMYEEFPQEFLEMVNRMDPSYKLHQVPSKFEYYERDQVEFLREKWKEKYPWM